jgi:hypothetical protein
MNLKEELDFSIKQFGEPKKVIMSLSTFNDLLEQYGTELIQIDNKRLVLYNKYIIGFRKMRYGEFIVSR